MAGFDKVRLMDKLIALGWREPNEEERKVLAEDGGNPGYFLIMPHELYANMSKFFHVYDARDLQNLLGEPIIEE